MLPRIAFSGIMCSGKTTWAEFLTQNYGYERERFARTIYDGVSKIFGISEAEILADKTFWRPVLQAFGTHVVRNPESLGKSPSELFERLVRDVDPMRLQRFPTVETVERAAHYFSKHPYGVPDAFVTMTQTRIREDFPASAAIAVDDVRFVNEAEGLRALGFWIVKLDCPMDVALERMRQRDGKADPLLFEDPSEKEHPFIVADLTIDATLPMPVIAEQLKGLIARK